MPKDFRFNLPPTDEYDVNPLDSSRDVRLARLTRMDDLITIMVGLKKAGRKGSKVYNIKEIYPNSILVGRRNISNPENVSTVANKIIKSLGEKIRAEFPDRKLLRTIAIYPYQVPENEGVCNHTVIRIVVGTTDRVKTDVDACIGAYGEGISEIYTVQSMKAGYWPAAGQDGTGPDVRD